MNHTSTENYKNINKLYQDLKKQSENLALKELYKVADLGIIQDFKKFNTKVACKKSCSFCCSIPVEVTQSEVDYILHHVKNNGISINFKNRVKKNPANSKFETCVFLDNETNTCKIYEARPISCRKHFVITSSEHCKELSEKIGRYYPQIPLIISSILFNNSSRGFLNKMIEEKFHSINTFSYKFKCFFQSFLRLFNKKNPESSRLRILVFKF